MAGAALNKNDARFLATQERIEDAFWELLEQEGFQKVTVRKLSGLASINRGTFYLHAQDKYDLLGQVEDRIHRGMMGGSDALLAAASSAGKLPLAAPMVAGAEYAYANRNRIMLLMDGSCDPLFFSKYAAKVRAALLGHIGEPTPEQRYALALMEGAIGGFFNEWVRGGMRETPEVYVDIVAGIATKLNLPAVAELARRR